MKKTLAILAIVAAAFAFNTPRTYTFKFSEKEATQIIESLQTSETVSARDANTIVAKMQRQAADTTMNPIQK